MPRKIYLTIVDDLAEETETTMFEGVELTVRPPARDRGPAYVKLNPEDGLPYTISNWHWYALFDRKLVGDSPEDGNFRLATQLEIAAGEWVT